MTQDIPEEIQNLVLENHFKHKFELLGTLGKGAFGEVVKARNKIDNKIYAVKIVKIHVARDEKISNTKAVKESQLLATFDSPLVLRYYNTWLEFPT